MHTETATPLAMGKCPNCRRTVTVTKAEAIAEGWQVLSPCCHTYTVVNTVRGTVTSKACGAHCTDATSMTCKCECGGAQHGMAWRTR
jgi:hypothetical protein